ncbi:CHASE2 domain-containing protein [Spirochaetota bacterium]
MQKIKASILLFKIPVFIGLAFALLYLAPAWQNLERRAYDLFLNFKPSVKEDASIILLDIDDPSIDAIGSYPWPRALIARGLEALSELGASYAIFDIEYLEKSPMSVDSNYLQGVLKSDFHASFEEIGSNVQDVFSALNNRQIALSEAGEYGVALVEMIDDTRDELYKKTGLVAIENDSYLGKAMRLFGNSYTTLNMQKTVMSEVFQEREDLGKERFFYPKTKIESVAASGTTGFLVPIPEISNMSKNAGFTNVEIDTDGVRRRLKLVEVIENKAFLQLAFSPLLRKLGEPDLLIHSKKIELIGAKYKDGIKNVSIPLDSKGMMLIRWPKKDYLDSFTHIPFHRLLDYRAGGEELVTHLRLLRANQGWSLGPGLAAIDTCLSAWAEAEELRQNALDNGGPQDRADWIQASSEFWDKCNAFLDSGFYDSILALFDMARDADAAAHAPIYDSIKDDFSRLYKNVENSYNNHVKLETALKERLNNAYCIIGWTSTGTTDIGVNPFIENYVNVGTHAAVANTILQQDFLREAPLWISAILAVIFAAATPLGIKRLNINLQIISGLVVTLVLLLLFYGIFHFTGIYVAFLSPVLAVFISFLFYSLLSFILSEREKSFLRKVFGTYLSGDVINEIIEDPSMLKLGGQKKWITAIFTDVKGFSSISEVLDAEHLVQLLNIYLSGMSDIILEEKGTIDKYEGDAIISFFGAPLHYEDHAIKACSSAVKMKRKEAELNIRFMEDKMSPNPLLTRIGINTGDMVVGNMGTERKMDYTIMGNAVNLAARLEGVNKQYGSWILLSDDTYKETGDIFTVRRFDRVRVVGINTPVQLWELVDFKSDVSPENLKLLERFEEAHQVFDKRDWNKALELFKVLLKDYPEDGPSKAYIRKCEVFKAKPPAPDWDGVFSLTEK